MRRFMLLTVLATALAAIVLAADRSAGPRAHAQAAPTGVGLVAVGRYTDPTFITSPPQDTRRLFVLEKAGRIREVLDGRNLQHLFLDISAKVLSDGERGLLGLAFAPDYASSGLFYVYYTGKDTRQHLVEFRRANADYADPASARTVFVHDDPQPNHNGGMLAFGPDGYLYVATGDGGGANDPHGTYGNAQNLGSPLGKILRINPRSSASAGSYSVPSSNPFMGLAGARPEIYAYGLRNPWRFSFDRATGDIVIADVGQDAVEEVDFARKGGARGVNYGWRPWEGNRRNFDEPAPGAVFPVLTHLHTEGFCSITGGYVVRDPDLPALYGRYIYGDYCQGRIRKVSLSTGTAIGDAEVAGLPTVSWISSFGEDARGRVYVVSLSGPIYRFVAR